MKPQIILASESFLKRFIMEASRLPYEAVASDIDELAFDHLPVEERVVALAEKKGRVISEQYPDTIVIAADTLNTDENGKIQDKETSSTDPFNQALALSGATTDVYTGCYFHSPGHTATYLATGSITYQTFSKENLERLTKGDNYKIRGGALGVFHDAPGFTLVKKWRGSYTGLLGLPMEFVYEQLEQIDYFS